VEGKRSKQARLHLEFPAPEDAWCVTRTSRIPGRLAKSQFYDRAGGVFHRQENLLPWLQLTEITQKYVLT